MEFYYQNFTCIIRPINKTYSKQMSVWHFVRTIRAASHQTPSANSKQIEPTVKYFVDGKSALFVLLKRRAEIVDCIFFQRPCRLKKLSWWLPFLCLRASLKRFAFAFPFASWRKASPPWWGAVCLREHVTSRNQGTFSREEERGPWERGWRKCRYRNCITLPCRLYESFLFCVCVL